MRTIDYGTGSRSGEPFETRIHSYDGRGRLRETSVYAGEKGEASEPRRVVDYEYDRHENRVRKTTGSPAGREAWEYDCP